jgi:hypothetical protein
VFSERRLQSSERPGRESWPILHRPQQGVDSHKISTFRGIWLHRELLNSLGIGTWPSSGRQPANKTPDRERPGAPEGIPTRSSPLPGTGAAISRQPPSRANFGFTTGRHPPNHQRQSAFNRQEPRRNIQFSKTQCRARADPSGLSEASPLADGICQANLAPLARPADFWRRGASERGLSDLRSFIADPVYDGVEVRSVGRRKVGPRLRRAGQVRIEPILVRF